MKYFVYLCLLNYCVVSFGFNLNDTCIVKTGIKFENVRNLLMNGEPESKEENCFLGCFWKKINVMNEDNSINVKQIKENFKSSKTFNEDLYSSLVGVFENCDTETKPKVVNVDECEAANIISKCVFPKLNKVKEEFTSNLTSK